MLDLKKVKNFSQNMASKVADKASEVNTKVSKRAPVEENYIVGLDIGTEYVKALIGKVVGDHIEVIGVGRQRQGLSDMQAGAIADITRVVQNCDAALAEAEEQAGVSARSAVIGIAGELVKGTTTTVRVKRKEAEKALDLPEVERIIRLVQARAEAKAKQQMTWELGGKDVDVRLVNSALVGMEIDGYRVTNPVGFQGRDVVVQLYTAFAPLIHIGALERTAQQLDLDLLAVAAEPFAVSRSVIGDDTSASMSAILMDIGGGTTDIAVVDEGGVQGTKMFGIGGRAFTRSIERQLGVDFEQAEELKVHIADDPSAQTKTKAALGAIEKTLDVWTSGVELALAEFDQMDHLPHRVLLCGGGSSLEPLMNRLEQTDWYRELPFTRKPSIQHIHPDSVVGIVDTTGKVSDHTFITAMGLLRVGLDTMQFSGTGQPKNIREKIDKMLRV